MNWYDIDAPVTESTMELSYQEGAEFILKHFGEFGPHWSRFHVKHLKIVGLKRKIVQTNDLADSVQECRCLSNLVFS